MSPQAQTEIITLLIVALVIARFLVRELRARTVRVSTLWIRPAFLAAMTALIVWVTLRVPEATTPGPASAPLIPSLIAGASVGLIVGILVAYSTSVESVGTPGVVRLRGSWVTVAIWIVALVLRMSARFVVGGSVTASSPALTSGTVILVAVAFTAFAILIAQRARALA